METISILGSTGSIGRQTIEVAERLGLAITAISANSGAVLIEEQARRVKPRFAALYDEDAAGDLRIRLADTNVKVLSGAEGVIACAMEGDAVLSAISGFAGLRPAMAAIKRGARLALANKETLVSAGAIVMDAVSKYGAELIPVDSEHSAIFQCLQGRLHPPRGERREAAGGDYKILLTCSGGPFRGFTAEQLERVTVADALKNPNWSMGPKITVDSATLMNKGLEFIEAMRLFSVSPERVEVIVHAQSVIHSAVEFADGAVIAQLGVSDMRIPIQYALTYPERVPGLSKRLDLTEIGSLTFEKPDLETFRCLDLAIKCAERDYRAETCECLVLNAANETTVDAFLKEKRKFTEIPHIIENVLGRYSGVRGSSLDELTELDADVRRVTAECI
ncbi:MAG: 1-deoxy-D-xylulose-5-phosphate reductoisomerase [Oscillospiraceae bacterium]|jgi:1-deoxy-D-xylulose-5-phosphate reductoisomerase|nr:1-deoxy-D-xylulose-5-phosphate reductoisomerase [Oscillospiraceae bacterium]